MEIIQLRFCPTIYYFTKFQKTYWFSSLINGLLKKTNNLIPLAKSKFGVEIIKHPKKIIYGVQFHPEIKVSRNYSKKILNNFLEIVKYNIK